jgi:hypothetical protein
MFPIHMLSAMLLLVSPWPANPSAGQQPQDSYLVIDIQPKDEQSSFEFEGACLMRSGKECTLQRLEGKAPFKISVQNAAFFFLRGKEGEGKVGYRYKVAKEEKRTMQYFNAGEGIVIDFLPQGGAGTSWTDGKIFGSVYKLSVTMLTKE